ncbi:MAG TPA: hypothetical protein DCE44_17395 [Verrucomicrobiales bacterium]|nr:hypothetical protein [Verrucomicrobiales bacterium]
MRQKDSVGGRVILKGSQQPGIAKTAKVKTANTISAHPLTNDWPSTVRIKVSELVGQLMISGVHDPVSPGVLKPSISSQREKL